MVTKEEKEELKEILDVDQEPRKEIKNIIYDERQYSIRIPMKFAKTMKINHKKDKFEFTLIIPQLGKGEPTLTGRLLKGKNGEEKET